MGKKIGGDGPEAGQEITLEVLGTEYAVLYDDYEDEPRIASADSEEQAYMFASLLGGEPKKRTIYGSEWGPITS